ncbi:NAD(P)/FAD-dependent oxidoreductase [Arthrobacter sp. 2MCAF15]|uniref:NAD(P)/FAD-dependent oxidoreductase n=1 Tax=Arthrobacter sp. 2MCAF15 TaxID=3232984 RepID=UPI003F92F556
MSEKKVVIIGAGVLGLGTALALAQHEGFTITVVERDHPGSGATSRAVGMALRAYKEPTHMQVARRSYEILERLERETGLTLRRIGHFMPGRTQTEIDSFHEIAEVHARIGWTKTKVLDSEGITRVFPEYTLPEDVIGALWDPEAIFIDGAELCASLTEAAKARGVTIVSRTTITRFDASAGDSRYVLESADGTTFPADLVVNAAGAWGARVGELLGAPVNVVNERHEAFIFRHQGIDRVLPMFLDFIPGYSNNEGLYFRGEGTDRLLAGLHSSQLLHADELVNPDSVSQRLADDHLEQVFGLLTEAFPEVEIGFDGGYAGIYPHHALNRFVIGQHPKNADVYVGAGLGGRGLGPGVALGEILAETIVYGKAKTVPGAEIFSPDERI